MTDYEINLATKLLPIDEIAKKLGLTPDDLEHYGKHKAKININNSLPNKQGKLILVSAINPTPAGEGKTTTTIGLVDGLNRLGHNTVAVLREPSLGPVFGMKGGATGGGQAQIAPMVDINLHFTGDFSAIEKANNLLAALIDNIINNKNASIQIDPRTVRFKRVMDMNDRSLRHIVTGLGAGNGMVREAGFDITAASEVMAILCIAIDQVDLKNRLGNIYVGNNYQGNPIFAKDIKAVEAMTILLKDAIKPNLVQTLEGNPAIVHGGPFANIAQGTNSVMATKMGLALADYAVTEAGFGFDLGGEKFLDIKCRIAALNPALVVLVATIRALKYQSGVSVDQLKIENVEAVRLGMPNLLKHVDNASAFNLDCIVAINYFEGDTEDEINTVKELCAAENIQVSVCKHWSNGGAGTEDLAKSVINSIAQQPEDQHYTPLYELHWSIQEKILAIATRIYGATTVLYSANALTSIKKIEKLGLQDLPICMAKTQYSFSDNPKLLGKPTDFTLNIRDIEWASGAGFIIPLCGEIMRMPGLPNLPASDDMFIDKDGTIIGLS
ncbi:MAG: formate--tetrahydrofolate ligase [Bacteroidota bacterium]|nr:formate--tetrahydrofolate ligase [Bacteroidota bacterium]